MPKYNSWTNYETWNVHLWLTSDTADYQILREMAVNHAPDVSALARAIEVHVRENMPAIAPSLYLDLLNASLAAVNWTEIAASFMDEVSND